MRTTVVGGTGKTGRAVCAALERRGHTALPLGRDVWTDLAGALGGCDAAYVIAPNMHPDEAAYVTTVVEAARDVGVARIVFHSVASPYTPAMPHHVGKAEAEDVVRRSGLAWTILQPGAYLQNLDLTQTVRLPYRADVQFGFADLDEVSEVAAIVLTEPGHEGATYELASRRPPSPSSLRRRASTWWWSARPESRAAARRRGCARCSPTTTSTACRSAPGRSRRCSKCEHDA